MHKSRGFFPSFRRDSRFSHFLNLPFPTDAWCGCKTRVDSSCSYIHPVSPRGPAGSSSRWAAARTTLPAPQAQLGEVQKWCCRIFQEILWKLKAWIVDSGFAKFLHHKVGAEEVLKCLPHCCADTDYSFQSNRAFPASFFFIIYLLSTHLKWCSFLTFFCQVCYSSWISSLRLVLHTRPNRKCCRCQQGCWSSTTAATSYGIRNGAGGRFLMTAATDVLLGDGRRRFLGIGFSDFRKKPILHDLCVTIAAHSLRNFSCFLVPLEVCTEFPWWILPVTSGTTSFFFPSRCDFWRTCRGSFLQWDETKWMIVPPQKALKDPAYLPTNIYNQYTYFLSKTFDQQDLKLHSVGLG